MQQRRQAAGVGQRAGSPAAARVAAQAAAAHRARGVPSGCRVCFLAAVVVVIITVATHSAVGVGFEAVRYGLQHGRRGHHYGHADEDDDGADGGVSHDAGAMADIVPHESHEERIRKQQEKRAMQRVRPTIVNLHPVGELSDEEVFRDLGLLPGVNRAVPADAGPLPKNRDVPVVTACECTYNFQADFFEKHTVAGADVVKHQGPRYRNGHLIPLGRGESVNLTVCSADPSGSYDQLATTATDHFFDSGAAVAMQEDFNRLLAVNASAAGHEAAEVRGSDEIPQRLRIRRIEVSGPRDTNCNVVIVPLPADEPRAAKRIACRLHRDYNDGEEPTPPLRAAFGLPPTPAGSKGLRPQADLDQQAVHRAAYELTVSPTQLYVRVRHVDGLRNGLMSALQMAFHTTHIEHRVRTHERKEVAAYDAVLTQSSPADDSDDPSLMTPVRRLLGRARGEKAPIPFTIPTVFIADRPAQAWRGLQLDVARHFHTATELKEVIRAMARRKLNRLQLHLTDDQGWRVESALFPSLHQLGGKRGPALNGKQFPKHKRSLEYKTPQFYTAEQIRDISDYAAARGISIVPEIDLPAHASALVIALQEDVGPSRSSTFAARFGKTQSTATHFKPRQFSDPAVDPDDSDPLNAPAGWSSREVAHDAQGLSVQRSRAKGLDDLLRKRFVPELDKLRSFRSPVSADQAEEETAYRFGFIRKTNDDCASFPMARPHRDSSGAPNCMGGTHGIVNPDDDGLMLVQAVLTEVAAIFDRSEYLHVGGDQAERIRNDAWLRFAKGKPPKYIIEQRRRRHVAELSVNAPVPTVAELQANFMDEVIIFVRDQLQRRPVVWDDTLLESGPKYTVPQGTIVALWREDGVSWSAVNERAGRVPLDFNSSLDTPAGGERSGAARASMTVPVVYMGKTRLYFDYIQYKGAAENRGSPHVQQPPSWAKHRSVSLHRAYDSRLALPPASQRSGHLASVHVSGTQACLWSELVPDATQLRYLLFPRLYAVADAAWASVPHGVLDSPVDRIVERESCDGIFQKDPEKTKAARHGACGEVGGSLSWSDPIATALRVVHLSKKPVDGLTLSQYHRRYIAFLRLLSLGLPGDDANPECRG